MPAMVSVFENGETWMFGKQVLGLVDMVWSESLRDKRVCATFLLSRKSHHLHHFISSHKLDVFLVYRQFRQI